MKKQDREKVYNKYNGRCAYCGNKIEYKDMQVDHIFPKNKAHWLKSPAMREMYSELHNMPDSENIDDFNNLNPSCRRCNHYKRAYTLNQFRGEMLTIHERIQKQYLDKIGIDYGIIVIKPFDGKFYFEKEMYKDVKSIENVLNDLC